MTSRRAALAIAALALAALAVTSFLVSSRPPRAINLQSTQFAGKAQTNPQTTRAGPAQTSDSSADSSAPAVTRVWPQPTPFTSHLVATLTNLDFTQGPITEEQAVIWKHTLQRLTEQGPEAVPGIHEFLAQNRELDFTSNPGGNLLGQSSLRSAMINALGQIGGPDATAALLEALQTTTLPTEIPLLAKILDEQNPGQYGQQILKAVTDVLTMAAAGQLPLEWDVAPLFKLVQADGDSATAAALGEFEGPYKYYATMALAGMPDAAGLPELIRQSKSSDDPGRRDFAAQMLAQIATQSPDATAALIDQAKADQISDAAWRKMAIALAVDHYQIGQPPGDSDAGANPIPGLKTFHVDIHNQNFYSLPLAPGDHVSERLALIDQLLEAAASNPAAQSALRSARTSLTTIAAN
jgi:HEAT repeat protein